MARVLCHDSPSQNTFLTLFSKHLSYSSLEWGRPILFLIWCVPLPFITINSIKYSYHIFHIPSNPECRFSFVVLVLCLYAHYVYDSMYFLDDFLSYIIKSYNYKDFLLKEIQHNFSVKKGVQFCCGAQW